MMASPPSIIRELEEIEGIEYNYYFPHYGDEFHFNKSDLCRIARPGDLTAQALATVASMTGILLNLLVLCVVMVFKEYKISWQHWLVFQVMISNVIFLLAVFLQTVNEHYDRWVMGNAICKLDEASVFTSHAAGVVFLAIANLCGIFSEIGFTPKCLPTVAWSRKRVAQILKSILVLLLVWMPCALVNLPLYRYNSVSDCERCVLEFPIDVGEICPMLGFNSTTCVEMMNFFLDEMLNSTEYFDDPEVLNFSGEEFDPNEIEDILETNLTEMAAMSACKYEEPRSFFIWLFGTFALFYATPIPILLAFCVLWFYDVMRRKTRKANVQNKSSMRKVIFALDVVFFLCWTPWNALHMKKAYDGLQSEDGYKCASVLHYSRFAALLYNAVGPIIYAALADDFLSQLKTMFNLLQNVFYRLLNMKEKSSSAGSDKGVTSSDDALTEGTTDETMTEGNDGMGLSFAPPTATAV